MTTTTDVYPGTDFLVRICWAADCQRVIERLIDVWVDVDSNCCVCTACRWKARDDYDTAEEWGMAIIPAGGILARDLNLLDEG